MTVDFTNAVGTAFGKIQVEEGALAILRPIAAESITKSGECRVLVCAETAAAAADVSVACSDKLSVDAEDHGQGSGPVREWDRVW